MRRRCVSKIELLPSTFVYIIINKSLGKENTAAKKLTDVVDNTQSKKCKHLINIITTSCLSHYITQARVPLTPLNCSLTKVCYKIMYLVVFSHLTG